MTEIVRVTIEIYGGETCTATGPAGDMQAVVARHLRALGLHEGPSVVVQDCIEFYPRATAALYRVGYNHTTAEPVGRITAVRGTAAASGKPQAASNGDGDGGAGEAPAVQGCTGEAPAPRTTEEAQP